MTNTMSLQDLINAQETNRVSRRGNYTEYGSKKKLEDAKVLDDATMKMVRELKGTFNFSLHNSKKYLIVTFYNKKDKYRFVVIDLEKLVASPQPSIKIAKKTVEEELNKNTVEPIEESKQEELKVEEIEEKEETKKPKAKKAK